MVLEIGLVILLVVLGPSPMVDMMWSMQGQVPFQCLKIVGSKRLGEQSRQSMQTVLRVETHLSAARPPTRQYLAPTMVRFQQERSGEALALKVHYVVALAVMPWKMQRLEGRLEVEVELQVEAAVVLLHLSQGCCQQAQ